jgi:hypothetical protein
LLSQPLWQISLLGKTAELGPAAYSAASRDIAQFLIGVKTGASAINDAIGAVVPEGQIMQGASNLAVDVQKALSACQDLKSVIQSKSSEELLYRAVTVLPDVKNKVGPVIDAAEGVVEASNSASEYSEYVQTLNDRLDALDNQISKAQSSIQSSEDGVRAQTAAGLAAFCAIQPPVALDDNYTITFDAGHAESLCVLQNDSDPNGDKISVDSVDVTGAIGTATLGSGSIDSGGGTCVTYVQPADFAQSDQFRYTITDGKGGSACATVTINFTKPDKSDDDFDSALSTASSQANALASNLLDAQMKEESAQIARNQQAADTIARQRQQDAGSPDGLAAFGGGIRGVYSGVSAARCQILQQNPSHSCDELQGCARLQAQISVQWLQQNRAALTQPANQAQGQFATAVLSSSNRIASAPCNTIMAVIASESSKTITGMPAIPPPAYQNQSRTGTSGTKACPPCGSPPCSCH